MTDVGQSFFWLWIISRHCVSSISFVRGEGYREYLISEALPLVIMLHALSFYITIYCNKCNARVVDFYGIFFISCCPLVSFYWERWMLSLPRKGIYRIISSLKTDFKISCKHSILILNKHVNAMNTYLPVFLLKFLEIPANLAKAELYSWCSNFLSPHLHCPKLDVCPQIMRARAWNVIDEPGWPLMTFLGEPKLESVWRAVGPNINLRAWLQSPHELKFNIIKKSVLGPEKDYRLGWRNKHRFSKDDNKKKNNNNISTLNASQCHRRIGEFWGKKKSNDCKLLALLL